MGQESRESGQASSEEHQAGVEPCSPFHSWGRGLIKGCFSSPLETGPDNKECLSSVGRMTLLRGHSAHFSQKARMEGRQKEGREKEAKRMEGHEEECG